MTNAVAVLVLTPTVAPPRNLLTLWRILPVELKIEVLNNLISIGETFSFPDFQRDSESSFNRVLIPLLSSAETHGITKELVTKHFYTKNKDVATLFGLGVPCAIQFDVAKTELIHFTTGKESLAASLTHPDRTVITPKPVVKWCRIHLDNALSFKEHVSIRTSQAQSAFYRMCCLANSERGLSPYALRQLYMACVTSVADYGCQVYWKGQALVTSKLQGLQNMALRKILGTFCTSPTLPSEVEAALPPPAIRLNTALCQYAFRARKLPDSHPIKKATQVIESQLYSQHHSDSEYDSDASDQSLYTHKMLEGPPRQLQQIGQSIHCTLSTPEELLIL